MNEGQSYHTGQGAVKSVPDRRIGYRPPGDISMASHPNTALHTSNARSTPSPVTS